MTKIVTKAERNAASRCISFTLILNDMRRFALKVGDLEKFTLHFSFIRLLVKHKRPWSLQKRS